MKKSNFIEHISRRIQISDEEINIILSKGTYKKYKKGELIAKQNEVAKCTIFIISGCTKTFYTDADGNNHVVAFGIEDWWAGDLASFVSGNKADFSIKSLEDSEVLVLSTSDFEELYREVPIFERFYRKLVQSAYVSTQKRIIQNFSLTAKERYLYFSEKYPQFEQRIPQYLIASYLGITKEFLSKIKKTIATERNSVE